MSERHEVCPGCPMAAVFRAARAAAENPHHKESARTLGGILLTEQMLTIVVESVGCDGSATNSNGQNVCPNEASALSARNMGATNWPHNAYNIPLDMFVAADTPKDGEPNAASAERTGGPYL